MKVYMATDMEGASGVCQELMTFADQGRYQEGRRALTLDVNAAIRGARAAGADEIVVSDGHGACGGYNFIFEELEAGARFIFGTPRSGFGLGSEGADVAFCVAYHGMAGAYPAVLDHTQSSRAIVEISLNGRVLGELGLTAAVLGDEGVPVGLVTGDDATCAEARELFGESVVTAEVKQALSRTSAICMAPDDARSLIERRAREAVQRAGELQPFVIEPPVVMRVQYLRTEQAQRWRSREDVEMLDGRTAEFECASALEAMNIYAGYA
ncbi:MAG: M55 family metallopeptidase [Armatimonadota bacterium]|nr:M55 family metallopeptidase [Armatimonadota bacterium]